MLVKTLPAERVDAIRSATAEAVAAEYADGGRFRIPVTSVVLTARAV